MFGRSSAVILAAALLSANSQAAPEYFRFQGKITNFHDDPYFPSAGYDATLGFVPGQNVYFDFKVDTALDVADIPDWSFLDNFAVTYLAGSRPGPAVTVGSTTSFPEGDTTSLFVGNSLHVGSSWSSLGNPSDESIDTWVVGDALSLMNNGYMHEHVIGNLTLTYRGATLPPAIPIPATAWLLGSALIGLAGVARRSKAP
jgi:hypothetical protein